MSTTYSDLNARNRVSPERRGRQAQLVSLCVYLSRVRHGVQPAGDRE